MASLKTAVTKPQTLQRKIDQTDSSNVYIGAAKMGEATSVPMWQIQKIIIVGGVTSIQYANGSDAFANIWDNRASLSYS